TIKRPSGSQHITRVYFLRWRKLLNARTAGQYMKSGTTKPCPRITVWRTVKSAGNTWTRGPARTFATTNSSRCQTARMFERGRALTNTIGGRQLSPRSKPHEASTGIRRARSLQLCSVASSRGDRVMAKHIEDMSQFLQSFGVAPLALLLLPVLITALARNVTLVLATSLLSFASLMLFVAPASATSGLAIVSGLGSFLVALESVVARGRMMALNKEIADLTTRVDHLERAEQRRLTLEIKARDHPRD